MPSSRPRPVECESVVDESFQHSPSTLSHHHASLTGPSSSSLPPSALSALKSKKANRTPSLHSDSGYSSRTAATASTSSATSGHSTEKATSTRPPRKDSLRPASKPTLASADAPIKRQSIPARTASRSSSTPTPHLSPTRSTRPPPCGNPNCSDPTCTMASRGPKQPPPPLMVAPLHAAQGYPPYSTAVPTPTHFPPAPQTPTFSPYPPSYSQPPVLVAQPQPPQPRPRRPSMARPRPSSFAEGVGHGHWVPAAPPPPPAVGHWVPTASIQTSPTSPVKRRPPLEHSFTTSDARAQPPPASYDYSRPVARSHDGYGAMTQPPSLARSSSTRHPRKLSTSRPDRAHDDLRSPDIAYDPTLDPNRTIRPPRTSSRPVVLNPDVFQSTSEPAHALATQKRDRTTSHPPPAQAKHRSGPSATSQDVIQERMRDAEQYQQTSATGKDAGMSTELTADERRQRRDSKTPSTSDHVRTKSGTAQTSRSRTGSSIGASDTSRFKAEWTARGLEVSGAPGDSVEVERDEDGRQKLIFVEGRRGDGKSYYGESSVRSGKSVGESFAKRVSKRDSYRDAERRTAAENSGRRHSVAIEDGSD